MRVLDIIYGLAGLLAVGAGVYFFLNPPFADAAPEDVEPRLPLVEIATAETSNQVASIRQTALLRPAAEVIVTAETAGRVVWINPAFELGLRLAESDEVFRLDASRLETDLARAQADVESAAAEQDRLQEDFNRIAQLEERGVSTQSTLTTAEAGLTAANARLAQTRAALQGAQIALNDTSVVVPFDAIVTAESLSLGQFLQPGTEVGRLVDATRAELLVRLNADQLRLIQEGAPVEGRDVIVRATDGSGLEKPGVIQQVSFSAEAATQTTGVLVRINDPFSNGGGVFRINSLFEVEIALPNADGTILSVPVQALQRDDRVWIVNGSALRPSDATIERRIDDTVLIRSDTLQAGDQILLTRLPNAMDGLRVRVVEERATTTDQSE